MNLRSIGFIAALVACSLTAASVLASDPSTASPASSALPSLPAPEQEVRAAAAAIVSAFGRNDRTAYFALFAPDATFVFHTTPRRLNSRAEYEAEWSKWVAEDQFKPLACSSSDQRVQLLGQTAIFTHSVRTELSTREGTSTLRERETIVFERRDGRWLGVHEHLSPEP